MARSTIKFLKQQGQFNARIAALVGCDRHTVARILTEPTDPPRRRCGIGSESCGIGSESCGIGSESGCEIGS